MKVSEGFGFSTFWQKKQPKGIAVLGLAEIVMSILTIYKLIYESINHENNLQINCKWKHSLVAAPAKYTQFL